MVHDKSYYVKKARINELKTYLKATDYKSIKYAEGELSEEEFEPIKEQRKAWRAEINELQAQLQTYEDDIITEE